MGNQNYLRITDLVQFSLTNEHLVQVKDDYEGAFKPDKPGHTHHTGMGTVSEGQTQTTPSGLQVRIAATHSGIITRNNGFYLPDKMRKGSSSFTDHFPKPVLVHHDEHSDPIGRVYAADYVDTSGSIQDQFNLKQGLPVHDKSGKQVGVITDVLLKDFVEAKMPYGMQVDTVRTLLRDSLLDEADYSGLGHIQIVAHISDHAAIQKLLDGRYLTGSVGATTDRAICAICRQDWTKEGKCEHKPGGIYDGQKCFIITGNLLYDEYSFVNKPADRHSRVLELHYNGIQDSIVGVDDFISRIYEVSLGFPQYDSVNEEDTEMAKKKKGTPEATPEVVINDSDTSTPPVDENVKPEETPVQDATAEGEGNEPVQDDATPEGEGEVQDAAGEGTPEATEGGEAAIEDASTEETLEDFLVRVLDAEELTDEDEEKLYDAMWAELKDAVEKGECDCDCPDLEDAKLSTEKRKKLASSTFCGPGRSFPVPDCAHVTAARRLIGRYKGEGDKSKILSCVSRKAKALGCSGSSSKKKDAVQDNVKPEENQDAMHHARLMHVILAAIEENHYTPADDPALTDEEKGMLSQILKRLAGMVGKDSVTEALVAEGFALAPDAEQALCDEVAKYEDTVGELRDELSALRKEYSALYKDLEIVQDKLVDEKTNLRKSKEDHLSTLVNLRDAKVEERDWSELEDTAIDSEIERTLKDVDMSKITDKLGDGMSNNPTEEVESPVDIQDDNTNQKRLSVEDLTQIEQQYHTLLLRDGQVAAEAFIRRLQMEGKLPQDGDE